MIRLENGSSVRALDLHTGDILEAYDDKHTAAVVVEVIPIGVKSVYPRNEMQDVWGVTLKSCISKACVAIVTSHGCPWGKERYPTLFPNTNTTGENIIENLGKQCISLYLQHGNNTMNVETMAEDEVVTLWDETTKLVRDVELFDQLNTGGTVVWCEKWHKDAAVECRRNSKMCVSGDTFLITREDGIGLIESLEGATVEVWCGAEFGWQEGQVEQTHASSMVMRVVFSDGSSLDCTSSHMFPVCATPEGEINEMALSKIRPGMYVQTYRIKDIPEEHEIEPVVREFTTYTQAKRYQLVLTRGGHRSIITKGKKEEWVVGISRHNIPLQVKQITLQDYRKPVFNVTLKNPKVDRVLFGNSLCVV